MGRDSSRAEAINARASLSIAVGHWIAGRERLDLGAERKTMPDSARLTVSESAARRIAELRRSQDAAGLMLKLTCATGVN